MMSEEDELKAHIAWFKREFPILVRYIIRAHIALGLPVFRGIRMYDVFKEREKFRKMFKE